MLLVWHLRYLWHLDLMWRISLDLCDWLVILFAWKLNYFWRPNQLDCHILSFSFANWFLKCEKGTSITVHCAVCVCNVHYRNHYYIMCNTQRITNLPTMVFAVNNICTVTIIECENISKVKLSALIGFEVFTTVNFSHVQSKINWCHTVHTSLHRYTDPSERDASTTVHKMFMLNGLKLAKVFEILFLVENFQEIRRKRFQDMRKKTIALHLTCFVFVCFIFCIFFFVICTSSNSTASSFFYTELFRFGLAAGGFRSTKIFGWICRKSSDVYFLRVLECSMRHACYYSTFVLWNYVSIYTLRCYCRKKNVTRREKY